MVEAPVTSVTIRKANETETAEGIVVTAFFGAGDVGGSASVKIDGTFVKWINRIPNASNYANIILTKRAAPYQICVV